MLQDMHPECGGSAFYANAEGRKKPFSMKKAIVLHNPGAGEGEISEEALVAEIVAAGFECSYSSTKQFRWEDLDTEDADFLILAGGDGTVRKVADELLRRKVLDKKLPLGLLPFGTANNIARTLGLSGPSPDIITSWRERSIKRFDVGTIEGLGKRSFFLESFGYGVFPRLMKEMDKAGHDDIENPKRKIQVALEVLYDLVRKVPVKRCDLQIDDIDYSGEFLLIEVMNIRSIGPNLNLAPNADPGDGEFDVVLVTEQQRLHLAEYVRKKIGGADIPFDFPLLKAKKLSIRYDGRHVHVDDEYYKLDKPTSVSIELRAGLLEFLTGSAGLQD